MIKKRINIISFTTCLIFTVVMLFSLPTYIFSATGGTSSGSVRSEVEPLPYIIVGALVVFASIIIFDVIFHPYQEKKDEGKKLVHAKVDENKSKEPLPKPEYSTDYDYLLGMSAAQFTQQMAVTLPKVKRNP